MEIWESEHVNVNFGEVSSDVEASQNNEGKDRLEEADKTPSVSSRDGFGFAPRNIVGHRGLNRLWATKDLAPPPGGY